MEIAKQITAFLQNKPGRLGQICSALGREKINIHALTVMDSKDRNVLRLITDDVVKTKAVLNSVGTEFQESDVLMVEMPHHPGAMARVCERLAEEHIGIDYAYCSAGPGNGKALGFFKVSNLTRATHALAGNGRIPTRQHQKPGRRPAYAR